MNAETTKKKELKNKASQFNPERKESNVAKGIESQTSRLPSDFFLWTGVGVMATSLVLKLLKKDHAGLFVAQWAAPLLLFGMYNKIVRPEGYGKGNSQSTNKMKDL